MELHRTGVNLDREEYRKINENWERIEEGYNQLVGNISEEVIGELIDSAKLIWKEPVDTVNDLPSSPETGETRMVRETGAVYRYDGSQWVEIQEIDPTAINEVDSRLSAKIEEVDGTHASIGNVWEPPILPDTLRGNGTVPSGYDPDEHLDALIEPLVDGKYVTRTDLGPTTDGEYIIRRYDFTPENYEKTIIITACLHGNEYTGFYSLYQFLDLLVKRWREWPQLAYLRKNVRLITIPIVNMWGFANQSRYNVNQVDLNRNWPLYWDEFASTQPGMTYYKGPAPLSENESQILNGVLQDFSDAVAVIDMHTTNVVQGEYVLYHPRYLNNYTREFESVAQLLKREGEAIIWSGSRLPSFTTWACHEYNMNVANPEFVNGLAGSTRSSEEMTRAARWFGNIILAAATLKKPTGLVLEDPFVKVVRYEKTSDETAISFTSQVYNNIDQTYLSFRANTNGLLIFNGQITFSTNSFATGATVNFFPHMYQQSAPDFDYERWKDDPFTESTFVVPDVGTYTIPLTGQLFVQVTSDRDRAGNVVFRLRGKTSGGRITIEKIVGQLIFLPSSRGDRFEVYDATGNEELGTGAMTKIFPDDGVDDGDSE